MPWVQVARKQGRASTCDINSEGEPRLSPEASLPATRPPTAQLEAVQQQLHISRKQLPSHRQRFELQEIKMVSSLFTQL